MTDTVAALTQRIDELESALHEAKAGNIMEALAMQLGIEYNVARCKWVAAGYPRKCFADALDAALKDDVEADEDLLDWLECDLCGQPAAKPYDVGDGCICGGKFKVKEVTP